MSEPLRSLQLAHGTLHLPAFLPDATFGVVRAVDSADLERVGVEALVMNVYHLMQKPGSSTISALGGIHGMSGWNRPIVTDSGGFQAYSLIRQNPRFGKLTDDGIRFKPEGAEREFSLTPEKSVQLQLSYGADIVICLDDCTHVEDSLEMQIKSVERTIRWAKRCKVEFDKQIKQRKWKEETPRPLLFGVIQGGGEKSLRRECAESLLEMGFDGFGYGGYPLDKDGKLLTDMLGYTRSLIPREYPMHALGVGHPESIRQCIGLGYDMFDCALPTRDARSGRLYVWRMEPHFVPFANEVKWFDTLYIDDEKHIKNQNPLSEYCTCPVCARYSVGYLRHLHKCGETLYFRLATLHNLCFLQQLVRVWQKGE